jgi:predicted nucleic acid-binding protein
MILFLDACTIIYLIEAEAEFHATAVGRLRDLRAQFPCSQLAASRLSLLECLVKPTRDGETALIREYRGFFAARDLLLVELTAAVVESTIALRVCHGLRTPDALQAASALTLPTDGHRFLTNDRRFERVAGLRSIQVERPGPNRAPT